MSLWNGVAKFCHDQYPIARDAVGYIMEVLTQLYPLLYLYRLLTLDEAVARTLSPEHRMKACGYPASFSGCTTKQSALELHTPQQLMEYYYGNTTLIGSTLKDELRPVGKDARLFRPQDVSSYMEGTMLFTLQNEYLMNFCHSTPLFVKFTTPGPDIIRLHRRLKEFGDIYCADGSQWDANFPLIIAEIICSFRCAAMPDAKERIERYYSMMYNGYTDVDGELCHLVGQPSGHVNTTVDNSLAHVIAFSYHAWLHKLTIEQFLKSVLFSTCGDDIIWSDKSGLFTPASLSDTYLSLGMYLEFESLTPGLGTFVGAVPSKRTLNGVTYVGYCNRLGRAMAGSEFMKSSATALDKLAKLTSLAQKCFFDEEVFGLLRDKARAFAGEAVSKGWISPVDPNVGGLLSSLSDEVLLRRYLGYESGACR